MNDKNSDWMRGKMGLAGLPRLDRRRDGKNIFIMALRGKHASRSAYIIISNISHNDEIKTALKTLKFDVTFPILYPEQTGWPRCRQNNTELNLAFKSVLSPREHKPTRQFPISSEEVDQC